MPVSAAERCVFVHIPKTGGTSVEAALGLLGDWRFEDRERLYGRIRSPELAARPYLSRFLQHLTLDEIHEVLPESRDWFSFAFVRNPWDRVVSTWSNPDPHMVRAAHDLGLELRGHSLAGFLERTAQLEHAHLAPQHAYLTDAAGELAVEHLGRFETLAADFEAICSRLGVTAELPHRNASRHRPYREHYDAATRQAVEERYGEDIERFGYGF